MFICFDMFFSMLYHSFCKILIVEERKRRLKEKREKAKARRDKINEAKKSQENPKKAVLHVQFSGTETVPSSPPN